MSDIEKYPENGLEMAWMYLRKSVREDESAEKIYNEKVCDVHFITDKQLNYKGALLNIEPHLIIDTHRFCLHADINEYYNKQSTRKVPADVKELVISLDKIAQKAYNDSKNKV
jgi:hypothetical protein